MSRSVDVISFSFKRGLPGQADMVFDARFLKNPFYEPALLHLSGLDEAAAAYIETDDAFAPFFLQMTTLLETLLTRYFNEERDKITIAVGCTGGRHRSVHVAQKLGGFLRGLGYNVTLCHRDLNIPA